MLSNEELLNEWTIYGIGHTIGKKGPEYGEILFDEQFQGKARITLERCKIFFAVTCGIYGLMLHTAYCEESEAMGKYREIKHCNRLSTHIVYYVAKLYTIIFMSKI